VIATKVSATRVIATKVIATKVIAIKTGSACIAVGAVTVVAVASVRIGPTIAAVTSKALPRNRHRTTAVATSRGSLSKPTASKINDI